jgi:hypothetical protein
MSSQLIQVGGKKLIRYGSPLQLKRPYNRFHANDTSAFVPEIWAQESVNLLWEQMLYASTVHRDFDNEIAEYGETVHTRKIGKFTAERKQNDLDDVTDQDLTATKIEVKLNQRVYISFVVGDGERSKSFKDLIQTYLAPAMLGQAQFLDRCIGGQVYQFLGNMSGGLEQLTSTTGSDYLLDSRQVMNDNLVGAENRWMALASRTETALQKVDLFKSAERVGDGGIALREALLGRKHSFNNFLSINTPSVRNATKSTATTTAAAALAGALTVSSTASVAAGVYFTIVGDYTPLRVASVAGTGPYTLTLTTNRPLMRAVASSAALQPYATGLIDQASPIAAGDTTLAVSDGYPEGWMKWIHVDGTGVPQQGQLVAFKAAAGTVHAPEYCITQVKAVASDYEIMLDRPLEDAVADNDVVTYGPNGDFNFYYQREALALVNRPLALPEAGTGARAALGVANGMSLRVVMTYDGKKQGTRVTVDGLFGMAKLDDDRGGVMLG